MGLTASAPTAVSAATVLGDDERNALNNVTGVECYPFDSPVWPQVISGRHALHLVDPAQIHVATRAYCDRMGTALTSFCVTIWTIV
jgi:hypothetical protein